MRKGDYVSLAVAFSFLLLAMIVFLPSGVGPGALDSEKRFIAGLHNSLYYLDQAKRKWADERQKSKGDVPTMNDLMPYLGDWTNGINRFIALGIKYKITPVSEMNQSDVATLTRDLRFRRGICRFYPSGTRLCLQTGWDSPEGGSASFHREFYFNNREWLAVGLFLLTIGGLLGFAIMKLRNRRRTTEIMPLLRSL